MHSYFKNLRIVILSAIPVILLASGLAVGQGKNTLKVTCRDADGNPIKGVELYLQRITVPDADNEKTNKKGETKFKKVMDGLYRIWGRREGYSPVIKDLFRISGGGETPLELRLDAGDSTEQLYFEDQALMEKANQLVFDAVNAFQKSDFANAEKDLKASLDIYPNSPDALQNLGLLYLRTKRWDEGEATLKESIHLLDLFSELGTPGLDERKKAIEQALAAIPIQKIAVEAEELMAARKYLEAIPKLEEIKKISPQNPDVHYNMAIAFAHADMIPEARIAIDTAMGIRAESDYKQLRDQIIEIEKSGQSLEAQQAISKIEAAYKEESFEEALKGCEAALVKLQAEYHEPIWRLKARTHRKLIQSDESVSAYKKAIELKPDNAETRKELALYLMESEKYPDAIQAYADLFAATSEAADEGFAKLADETGRKGEADLSHMLWEKVIEVNPEYWDAYYHLGMSYNYEKNDKAQAKLALEKFIEHGKNPSYLDNAKAVLTVMDMPVKKK